MHEYKFKLKQNVDNGNFFCLTLIHNWDFIFNLTSSVLIFSQVVFLLNSSKSLRLNDAFSNAADLIYLAC